MTTDASVRLQVLTCAFGKEGLDRFASTRPPRVPGVEYIVSLQLPDSDCDVPESLSSRNDVKICKTNSRGLSRNRNEAMKHASAPYCLWGDDDVVYDPQSLRALIALFDDNPDYDIICCAYHNNGEKVKPYPTTVVPVTSAPKGWYATSFEIAFRRESVAGSVKFNENFGIGAPLFIAGEEDIWLYDSRKRGARIYICPIVLCSHNHPTTSERHGADDCFVMTQGAMLNHLHPRTWRLRALRHAFRQKSISTLAYYRLCLRGAGYAKGCFQEG